MTVTIGRCGDSDIQEVVRFIDQQWMRGHALVVSRPLLDWLYRHPAGGYSFVVARIGGTVAGILGFIPTRRFDPALADTNVIWLTMWKVRDDAAVAGLGLALLQHLIAIEPHVAVGAIGFNPATRPIYQALGYQIGELDHYVLPNASLDRFDLASLTASAMNSARTQAPLRAVDLSGEDDFRRTADSWSAASDWVPRKTL